MRKGNNHPYWIEHKRELSDVERNILKFIIQNSQLHDFEKQMFTLKVIARCGCGKCPTILLGETFTSIPIENGQDLVQYMGMNEHGTYIGITLMGKKNRLTELEAYSLSGEDVHNWPELDTLYKIQ